MCCSICYVSKAVRIKLFAVRVSYPVLESDIGNNAALQLQQKRVCVFRAHGTCLLAANVVLPLSWTEGRIN